MDIFNKVQDLFKGIEKPAGLDKTKASLDKLKDQIKPDTIEAVLTKLRPSFMKDLDELEIKDEASRTKYWNELSEAVIAESKVEIPELSQLNDFLQKPGNLSAEIESKQGFLEKIKEASLGGGLATLLLAWSESSVDDKGKPTMFGSLLKTVAGWLSGEKKDEKKDEKKEASELAEPLLATLKKSFKDKSVPLYEDTGDKLLKGDFKWLVETAKMKIDDSNIQALVEETFVKNENVKKLISLADNKMERGSSFKVRLEYLLLKDLPSTTEFNPLNTLYAMVDGKDSTYALDPIDEKNIHQLFHDVVGAKDAKSILDQKYKKKAPAVATKQ